MADSGMNKENHQPSTAIEESFPTMEELLEFIGPPPGPHAQGIDVILVYLKIILFKYFVYVFI